MLQCFRAITIATLLLAGTYATAQPRNGIELDTNRTYNLGEVVVTADSIRSVNTTTVQRIPFARIARTDALTAAGVVYQIPAARVQTNSRGESLIYLRAAAERQVALFFDGALMNVPWDNRLDMSLIPIGAIGGITVSKGAPSVLYGPNTLGGTVNLVSIDPLESGPTTELQSQAGTNGVYGGSLLHMANTGTFRYIGEIGYSSRDGFALPGSSELAFHQQRNTLRTNTDIRSFNLYVRGENRFDDHSELGLAVHYADGEKGVAPEGHIEGARFWRYPKWQGLSVSVNGEFAFGAASEWSLRGSAWGTSFAQDIAQYPDVNYAIKSAQEEDRDLTIGTRVLLQRHLGNGDVTLAINALSSTHDQRDLQFDSAGAIRERRDSLGAPIPIPTLAYQQQLFGVGIETIQRFDPFSVTLGASIDGMLTPQTGDKPEQDPFTDFSVVGGAAYDVSESILLRASAGRKTRFPTMRELYGEALRRFLINPSLKPEETIVGELGFEARGEAGRVEVVGFAYDTRNAIDQRSIDTLGSTKRQRINLAGSSSLGAEVSGTWRDWSPLRIDGHFTYMYARGKANGVAGDSTFVLSEKPEIISGITAEYTFDFGLLPSIEIAYTGLAYSPNNDNEMVRLEPSTVVNLRLAYRFSPWDESFAQLFVRVNNATDALVQQQLGLPGPGREIVGGFKLSL